MYRVLLFLLLFFCNLIFGLDNSSILEEQFAGTTIDKRLASKIPYLQLESYRKNSQAIPTNNQYTLVFDPKEKTYNYFATITGRSIFKAKFIVSWYVFTNMNNIPNSIDTIMSLVNQQKPIYMNSISSINGKWVSFAKLPYHSLKSNNYVFAYISYPNTKGVLVPLGGQSFYNDPISKNLSREQSLTLNQELLTYWSKKGYL